MELYNLKDDPEEQFNLFNQHPDVVDRLSELADIQRKELGDRLTQIDGVGNREAGVADW